MAKQPQPTKPLMEMVGDSLTRYLAHDQDPAAASPVTGRIQESAPPVPDAPAKPTPKNKLDEDAFQFKSFWGSPISAAGAPAPEPVEPPAFSEEDVDFRKSEDEQRCVACSFYDKESSSCKVLRAEVNGDDLCDLFCGRGWGSMPELSNDERVLLIEGLVDSEGAADLMFDGLAITEFGPYILGECNGRRFAMGDTQLLSLLQQCGWVAGDVMAAVQAGRDAIEAEDEGEGEVEGAD